MFDSEVSYQEIFNKNESVKIRQDFTRLEDICYLDHTGTPAYPDSVTKAYLQDLSKNVYGNPHSGNLSGKLCTDTVDQIRYRILEHFNTSSKEYSVIFTSGATASLKLVAESFLWSNTEKSDIPQDVVSKEKSYFVYMEDNHTSVLGMREIISKSTAEVVCLNHNSTLEVFRDEKYTPSCSPKCSRNSLFVYSAQCNFSGVKYPLSWITDVQSGVLNTVTKNESNWFCLLDAATYVSTNKLDLGSVKPDFVAISFYKMFGFPTGIGALLVRNRSSNLLQKTYYGGGTVFMALSEENTYVPRTVLHERFEDGTVNFLSIIALAHGFNFWNKVASIEKISKHCFDLAQYAYNCLSRLHHANGSPVAVIYADSAYDDITTQGNILNFNLLRSNSEFIGYAEVLNLANLHGIHLRTGCFCNPGACRRHLKLTSDDIKKQFKSGHVCGDENDLIDGQPTGSIRISFGPYTNVDDIDKLLNMILNSFVQKPHVQKVPDAWLFKNETLKNKFNNFNQQISHTTDMLKAMSCIYFWFENVAGDYQDNSSHFENNSSKILAENKSECQPDIKKSLEGTYLSHIFLYPVKSCGQFCVEQWELSETGLKYDRRWMITTESGVALTQKNEPRLCLIKPIIDLEKKKLILTFKGFPRFSLDMENTKSETNNAWFCSSKVCGDAVTGQDCGDLVSSWLSLVLQRDGLRLIKLKERDSKIPGSLSLSNQAQYLFINKASVEWLSDQLDDNTDCKKESMLYRFRSNFVVSGFERPFEEQNWKKVTIGDQDFTVTGACGRCQMICIDQETGTKTLEPLTTLAASFKGKIKFGIYLSANNKTSSLNIGDPVSFETLQ